MDTPYEPSFLDPSELFRCDSVGEIDMDSEEGLDMEFIMTKLAELSVPQNEHDALAPFPSTPPPLTDEQLYDHGRRLVAKPHDKMRELVDAWEKVETFRRASAQEDKMLVREYKERRERRPLAAVQTDTLTMTTMIGQIKSLPVGSPLREVLGNYSLDANIHNEISYSNCTEIQFTGMVVAIVGVAMASMYLEATGRPNSLPDARDFDAVKDKAVELFPGTCFFSKAPIYAWADLHVFAKCAICCVPVYQK